MNNAFIYIASRLDDTLEGSRQAMSTPFYYYNPSRGCIGVFDLVQRCTHQSLGLRILYEPNRHKYDRL